MPTAGSASVRRPWEAIVPLGLALVAVLSLAYPLVAPVFAVAGALAAFRNARKTGSRLAHLAFAVCAVVLVIAPLIDVGLLAVSSTQIG